MSQGATLEARPAARRALGLAPLARILLGAAAISTVAGVAAVTLLDRLEGANELPRLAPAPPEQALPASATATGDTTVPDAATALAGHELAAEEPAPTF
jgi:hypothetical protein